MEYVMNDVEKGLLKMIEQDGVGAPIQAAVRALVEYAHSMSDMGLKDRAHEALEVADMLRDVRDSLDE